MQVALLTTFAASKKEPLADVMDRVRQAFLDSALGEPTIRFNFGDAPTAGFVSSVDRVLKRHPELERFVTDAAPMPGIPGARRISNGPLSRAAGEMLPYSTLHEIAAGVPRSFPFHGVLLHFHLPAFGEWSPAGVRSPEMLAGILLSDNWWVNGRQRGLSACTIVDADPSVKKLPPIPDAVASVFAACGKARRTIQAPLPNAAVGPVPGVRLPTGVMMPSAKPEAALAVQPIILDYRARMAEILERAAMPHELPELGKNVPIGATAGPRKPALEQAFKPLGYTCRGGSGTFDLRRRTAGNLTAEVHLDVGTWSHCVLGMYKVYGLGFKATLMLPVARNAVAAAQYYIGDAETWRKVCENLAALVAELDRTFVPALEAAAGPSPEWYDPDK
jgi:hypothetical protein